MKSFLVSCGLIAIWMCVVVYGLGVTPGNYKIETLTSGCTVLDTLAGQASAVYVNMADRPGVFDEEPNGLTSGVEVTTTTNTADKVTVINYNTNPAGFGTLDSSFSATYTFYVTSRAAGSPPITPALQVFIDTPQPSGGPSDKTLIYEPIYDEDAGAASRVTVGEWHRLTINYNKGQLWLRDTSMGRINCHWGGTTGCDPPFAENECYNPNTTPTSAQCSAPFAGGPNLPTISEYVNSSSTYPVGQIYGDLLKGARIVGLGINLGSFNPGVVATFTQMSITTDLGTYGFSFPKTDATVANMSSPCPAGPCDAPTAFNVSVNTELSSLYNRTTLAQGTDLSVELRLVFNSTGAQQNSTIKNFQYQCVVDYQNNLLRYLGSNGACYSVDFTNNAADGAAGSSVVCNFATPNPRFASFNATLGYNGTFRSSLRFNNFAGTVGTLVRINASCTPITDPTCTVPAIIVGTTQVTLSAANTCQAGTGSDCSGTCAGDFTLERESDVKLRVTNQGDVFMCPDARAGGQLINVCNLLSTIQS